MKKSLIEWRATHDKFTDSFGQSVITHQESLCKGEACVIHSQSNHRMRTWPTFLRLDKKFLVERICEHGVGHPDPDSLAYFIRWGFNYMSAHGCDGCCYDESEVVEDEDRQGPSVGSGRCKCGCYGCT